MPYVIADVNVLQTYATAKSVIAEHTGLVVAFGGLSPKNAAVSPGGVSRHHTRGWMSAARARGCRFVSVSPLRDDTPAEAQAEWIAPRPGTDTALMLALAQVLDADGLADTGFLDRCTVGFPRFARYLRGEADGVVKDPAWAEAITGVPAARIRELAHEMASARTMVTVSWSLQRARHGEQPLWLGVGKDFTEGRTAMEWLRHLYVEWRDSLAERDRGWSVPGFDEFWAGEGLELPVASEPQVAFADFRADPSKHPLTTPSGKIEIFSSTIDGYGYPDCPGHPVWLEPDEWLGSATVRRFGLQLVANQPKARLHSQLDIGAHSQSVKIAGREPVRMNPGDTQARGLRDGDLVRIFNDRGACLAGLAVDEAVRPGVAQLSTGAWYDPDPADPGFCRHGNPNVLTADVPSSTLSQGVQGSWPWSRLRRTAGLRRSCRSPGHPRPPDGSSARGFLTTPDLVSWPPGLLPNGG